MRDRFLRIVPRERYEAGFAPAKRASPALSRTAEEDSIVVLRDLEMSPRDWVVFLLHTAAEIEHALLVQYLYSAYSLRPGLEVPSDPDGAVTDDWIGEITSIAKEEMGHLVCLQNILHVLGGPLNFERQDFPYRSTLYPFPFSLQAFSKDSLAKYVAAEMPSVVDPSVLSQEDRDEIWQRATGNAGGEPVNHVGTLYRSLIDEVEDLPVEDFRADRRNLQGTLDEWRGDSDTEDPHGVKVIAITNADASQNKQDVLRSLRIIALQGEGASSSSVAGSHFERFLGIYRKLPPSGFEPAFPVGTDPYIPVQSGRGNDLPGGEVSEAESTPVGDPIENPATQLWAKLFNVRYRILLTELAHSLDIPSADAEGNSTPRSQLVDWAFSEMFNLGMLATRLAELPRGVGDSPTAGAPFGLPYTLNLPSRGPERWRLHLDLIDASTEIIRTIEDPPTNPFLERIFQFDVGDDGSGGRRVDVLALQNSEY